LPVFASRAITSKVCFRSPAMPSGWTKGWPSIMSFIGLALGSISPSIAVVRKIRSPQTIGEE
jgi:hypothetical protein